MGKLIDADNVLRYVADLCYSIEPCEGFRVNVTPEKVLEWVEKHINSLPESVVRCKDCENYVLGVCFKVDGIYETDPDFFCAWGERREDGVSVED